MAASVTLSGSASGIWNGLAITMPPAVSTTAIAFDAASNGSSANTVSTLTQAYTVGIGANYLLVGVQGDLTNDYITAGTVKFNAVSMTQITKQQVGSTRWCYLYGLSNPTADAMSHNIVVTATNSCDLIAVIAASYSGVSALSPDTTVVSSGNNQKVDLSVFVPGVAGCWGVVAAYSNANTSFTATATGTGQSPVIRAQLNGNGAFTLTDTAGTIPKLSAITLTANASRWALQRFDLKPRMEEHKG